MEVEAGLAVRLWLYGWVRSGAVGEGGRGKLGRRGGEGGVRVEGWGKDRGRMGEGWGKDEGRLRHRDRVGQSAVQSVEYYGPGDGSLPFGGGRKVWLQVEAPIASGSVLGKRIDIGVRDFLSLEASDRI